MRLYPLFPQAPNPAQLTIELNTALSVQNAACGFEGAGKYFVEVPDGITLQQVQVVIDVHNPSILTIEQQEFAQAESLKGLLKPLMQGLHSLSPVDKGYAIYCRLFAMRNNADQATINAIVNRPTAAAYITGLAEWQNLTAASKAFMSKELETNAALCTVLVLVLS